MAEPGNESSVARDLAETVFFFSRVCDRPGNTSSLGNAVYPHVLSFSNGTSCSDDTFQSEEDAMSTYFRTKDIYQTLPGKPKHMVTCM